MGKPNDTQDGGKSVAMQVNDQKVSLTRVQFKLLTGQVFAESATATRYHGVAVTGSALPLVTRPHALVMSVWNKHRTGLSRRG